MRRSPNLLVLAGGVAILAIAFATLLAYIRIERALDPLPQLAYRVPASHETNRILVGIVGDSWVAGEKLNSTLANALSGRGIDCRVLSSGHPGANSRQVYRNLNSTALGQKLGETREKLSAQSILNDPGLHYLVILAGVNDTAGHYGKDFYSHHMMAMITLSEQRGIIPVVVELPPFAVERVQRQGLLSEAKATLFRHLFDDGAANSIAAYRQALQERIATSDLKTAVLVPTETLLQHGTNTHLYSNPSHLNLDGTAQLARGIGQAIIRHHEGARAQSRLTP